MWEVPEVLKYGRNGSQPRITLNRVHRGLSHSGLTPLERTSTGSFGSPLCNDLLVASLSCILSCSTLSFILQFLRNLYMTLNVLRKWLAHLHMASPSIAHPQVLPAAAWSVKVLPATKQSCFVCHHTYVSVVRERTCQEKRNFGHGGSALVTFA